MGSATQAVAQKTIDDLMAELKARFGNDTLKIMSYFDQDGNNKISKREFIKNCEKLNFTVDEAKVFFEGLDKNHNQWISAIEFKDMLEMDRLNHKEFYSRIRQFVLDHKNYLTRTLSDIDRGRQQRLSVSQIKQAFSICGFMASQEEFQHLLDELKVQSDAYKNYDYYQLIDTIVARDESKAKL